MEFRVLGPLEVRVRDRPLALGGTRPRVVLAALLLGRNAVVPVDRLITAIWGDDPPGTPTAQIQAAVSTLRRTLAAAGDVDRIITRTPGYLIRIDRGELDLDEFDREVAAARRALAEGDVTRAADGLHAALEWWRDDALVDLTELPVRTAAVAVDERRWTAWEERIEADLALRRHGDLLPELSALVTKRPLRDRLWTQLMRAQYRSGRRADALATYQRARQVMRDELGLEPAAELAAVHRAILDDDPALAPDVLPLGAREWTRPPCPYRALEPYRPGDASVFFGRGAEIAAVAGRVRRGPVTVVGPSGSGKSSLVLAGVLAALDGCTALVVRPSDHGRLDLALAAALTGALTGAPTGALPPDDDPGDLPALAARIVDGGLDEVAARVLAHTGDQRLVVVLDQAEELLTQDGPLVDRVVTALYAPALADRLSVLATLRADFLGAVLERPALSTTLGGRAVFTLGAMGRDQLREAVTAPVAALPGVAFQAGLVDRILGDVGAEPGALALLGLTLTLLWDDQAAGTLTHQAYDDLGRVPGALATHAEAEWRRRNLADEEPALRRLVGRLVAVAAGDHVTRRLVARDELDAQAWGLAVRLSGTRLLVVSSDSGRAPTVELAHEALTTHWPRLRGWVEGDVDFHLWRTTLRADLERWRAADRDAALLLHGAVLAAARQWRTERGDELGPDETDYVQRSEHRQRTTGRRSGALRSGLAAAVVLVLVLATVFVHQRGRTAAASADADSRALAARAVGAAAHDPVLADLTAVAAFDRAPTDEARAALFARYRETDGLADLYAAPGVEPGAVRASADGRVVAATDAHSAVTVWVHDPGRPARILHAATRELQFDVAPDGTAVWLLAPDGVARLDLATGSQRTVVPTSWSGHAVLTLSADGTRILLRDRPDPAAPPERVRQWTTRDGQELAGATLTDLDPSVRPGRDAGSVLVQNRTTDAYRLEELDLATGRRSLVASGPVGALAADDSGVVTCAATGSGYVLTGVAVADRAPLGRVTLPGELDSCPVFVAGPGGRVVVDLGLGDVRLVDLTTGAASTVVPSPGVGSFPAAVTRDGSRLLTTGGSWVGTADLTAAGTATPRLREAAVLADGRALAGVSDDGRSLVVSPLVVGGPAARVPRPSPWVATDAIALRAGSSGLLADRVADHTLALHRLPGLDPLATVTLPAGHLQKMFFDDADRLVTVVDRQVLWWDVHTGALAHRLDLGGAAGADAGFSVAATPDPDLIAVVDDAHPDVTVRAVGDGHVVDTLPVGRDVASVSFQRSSDDVLVSRPTSTEVWDRRTRQRVVGPLSAGAGVERVAGMSSEPGRFVVLDSEPGSDHWQLHSYRVGVAEPLSSLDLGAGAVPGSASADDSVLALDRPDGGLAAVLRLDPAVWRATVCAALAGADLPADDRAGVPDGPVCAEPPAPPR